MTGCTSEKATDMYNGLTFGGKTLTARNARIVRDGLMLKKQRIQFGHSKMQLFPFLTEGPDN